MYRNNCRLTWLNLNCDIRICFGTQACRINDDRQISAETRHNFHFLPHFNSKTTGPIITKLLHNVEALVQLLMCALQGDIIFHLGTREQREKAVNFDVCKTLQKLIGYHSNIPWITVKPISVL